MSYAGSATTSGWRYPSKRLHVKSRNIPSVKSHVTDETVTSSSKMSETSNLDVDFKMLDIAEASTSRDEINASEIADWEKLLDAKLADILLHAQSQILENEEYSELEQQLVGLIAVTSKLDLTKRMIDTLTDIVFNETSPRSIKRILSVAHALTALGKIRHIDTQTERRTFLERVIRENSNAYLRSSAVLGLAYINDPISTDVIHRAEALEKDRSVKKQLRRVREQLEQTLAERQ